MSRFLSAAATGTAGLAWHLFQLVNSRFRDNPSIHPPWAPAPLLKTGERTRPPLGWPRETDSLCPGCVIEARDAVLAGRCSLPELNNGRIAEIKARIVEEQGRILIRKRCDKHGEYDDLLSIDPKFNELLDARYFGRDFRTAADAHVHRHGSSTIKYGRGSVLTIDLTNRCNMMCHPCFVDANQVGYVHELSFEQIKRILDDSISFKPRRQMSVQFSGGEPTLSPHFLEACRYAKEAGYYSVQAATNGLRFILEPEFAFQAQEAGLNMVYLQFDGVTNEANAHRHIENLFDAKARAIEKICEAGIDITPVTTLVNTVNDEQVGPIFDFMIRNSDKIGALSFQPVSFTGRDEAISDQERREKRYTISHLAHEISRHTGGKVDIYRDWYPLGSMGSLSWLADHLRGTGVDFGGMNCSCHPECGASLNLVVNWHTKAWAPLTAFFDFGQFIKDANLIVDSSRGKKLSVVQAALALIRNLDQRKMPSGLTVHKFLRLLNRKMGGLLTDKVQEDEWNIMWIGGMWFQDLWTYDFRRTEMCVIPHATQEGEISFCAYNTGLGWRRIVESKYQAAGTRDWFKDKGRHRIYAGGKKIELGPTSSELPDVQSRTGAPGADSDAVLLSTSSSDSE